jgi:hypothetical protein
VFEYQVQPDFFWDLSMTRIISRRAFLHGAGGIAAAGALSGSVGAVPIPNAQASSDPNVPPGVKFRGVNLAGSFTKTTAANGNDIWASLWGTWDWSGFIAPQLDDIAKVGNTLRIIGNTLVMALGSITLSQYLARWKQLLDHAQSLGLYVYPCGGDLGHWGNYTWAQSAETYTQLAQLLKSYPNVIGVDIVNEASQTLEQVGWTYNQPEPVADLLPELGGIVRSVGLPVTYSRGIANSSGWTLDYFTDHLGDFLDFHVYYLPGATDSLQAYDQFGVASKKLIIGEFGINTTSSPEDRTAYYNAMRLMCANDPRCVGALAWSAYDLAPTNDMQWGLFDEQRQLRADIGQPFSTFPVQL